MKKTIYKVAIKLCLKNELQKRAKKTNKMINLLKTLNKSKKTSRILSNPLESFFYSQSGRTTFEKRIRGASSIRS